MEVDNVDQDDGNEDIDSDIGGRLHSNSYETDSVIKGRLPLLLGKLCRLSVPSLDELDKEDENRMFDRFKFMKFGCNHTGRKGTRPLDKLLINKGGERSQEAGNLDEIDLQITVKWVNTRAKDSLKSYKECVKKRYGDDASKQPLFDPNSWIQAVGGRKKGRIYGFSNISDAYVVMTGYICWV
ncbi:hypothetical protein R6Q57_022451 [Mikania cordata]